MTILIWTGTAFALIGAIALLAMGLRARGSIEAAETPEARRAVLQRLAALNGGALAVGVVGLGMMVIGLIFG